jgi:hypothetical protein
LVPSSTLGGPTKYKKLGNAPGFLLYILVGIKEIKMHAIAILQNPARHSQRILLTILVVGALISIKLSSAIFPGSSLSSAAVPAKGGKSQEHGLRSGKSVWKKITESIKQGRTVPACSVAQRSLNQCN